MRAWFVGFFIADWFANNVTEPLVAVGKLKPHRVKVTPGGLTAVKDGRELNRNGKVGAEKLLYRVGKLVPPRSLTHDRAVVDQVAVADTLELQANGGGRERRRGRGIYTLEPCGKRGEDN